jgi:predicted alpha/beta hydrolase family esterase
MNKLDHYAVLTLPGRDGAGPDHWLSHWERAFPAFVRVEQANWNEPLYADWAATLSRHVAAASKPVVLIAHSLGTSLVMRWACDQPQLAMRVAGALLAAPSDRDVMEGKPGNPVKGFGPMLLRALPFPSLVLASRDDPFVTFERAQLFAAAWGGAIVDVGANGHLGSPANLGAWAIGMSALEQFIRFAPGNLALLGRE